MQPPETLLGFLPRELRELLAEHYLPRSHLFVETHLRDMASLGAIQYRHKGVLYQGILLEYASVQGYLSLLQWLVHSLGKIGPENRITIGLNAAYYGHMHVLEWFHQECWLRDDTRLCTHAACGGQLEALKWARAHGYPWNCRVIWEASHRGHLHVRQWALDNGCPTERYER